MTQSTLRKPKLNFWVREPALTRKLRSHLSLRTYLSDSWRSCRLRMISTPSTSNPCWTTKVVSPLLDLTGIRMSSLAETRFYQALEQMFQELSKCSSRRLSPRLAQLGANPSETPDVNRPGVSLSAATASQRIQSNEAKPIKHDKLGLNLSFYCH